MLGHKWRHLSDPRLGMKSIVSQLGSGFHTNTQPVLLGECVSAAGWCTGSPARGTPMPSFPRSLQSSHLQPSDRYREEGRGRGEIKGEKKIVNQRDKIRQLAADGCAASSSSSSGLCDNAPSSLPPSPP